MEKLGSKLKTKNTRTWVILAAVVALVVAFVAVRQWQVHKSALPPGVAAGNGRIEAKQVDVATKQPLRVKEILVSEGDLVKPGQVVVRMDTATLESELAEAKQNAAAAREKVAAAEASLARDNSQLQLAKIEQARQRGLVAERAGSQRDLDVRNMAVKTSTAALAEDTAKVQAAQEEVKAAEAKAQTVQTEIDDAVLKSPVLGRVLYRLTEPGEVLAAGGKALSLVNLEDVYMEIFLPSRQAAGVKVGDEARFKVDFLPDVVWPGYVSFVAPEAQFTPKQVETPSEREKLMFRVKIQAPKELVDRYIEQIKTGIRGVGYVRTQKDAQWPESLQKNLVPRSEVPPPARPSQAQPPAVSRQEGTPPPSGEARPSPQATRK